MPNHLAQSGAPVTTRPAAAGKTRLVTMEDHFDAYYAWRDAGVRGRVLVHVDAHHDMGWTLRPEARLTIANFICPAITTGLVSSIYWVVPDGTWATGAGRSAIRSHVHRLVRDYPGSQKPRFGDRLAEASPQGVALTVCSFDRLPHFETPVLLDLDTDFMMIPQVAYGHLDRHAAFPWCVPEELARRIRATGLTPEITTLAYSVNGGYTPLPWKFLGDDLALRMSGHEAALPDRRAMELILAGAAAEQAGDRVQAEASYRSAAELLPQAAAPPFRCARLCADAGRIAEAQTLYAQALQLDPSYRTGFATLGLPLYWAGRFRESRREWERILLLHPQDPYAHFGLGLLAMRRRRWEEAQRLLRRSLELDATLLDSLMALGNVLSHRGRRDDAIAAYESYLKLGLAGRRPLASFGYPGAGVIDCHHARVHARRALECEKKGRIGEAISGYRIAIAGDYDTFPVRLRLARLYGKQREWRAARDQLGGAWKALVSYGKASPRRLRRWFSVLTRSPEYAFGED